MIYLCMVDGVAAFDGHCFTIGLNKCNFKKRIIKFSCFQPHSQTAHLNSRRRLYVRELRNYVARQNRRLGQLVAARCRHRSRSCFRLIACPHLYKSLDQSRISYSTLTMCDAKFARINRVDIIVTGVVWGRWRHWVTAEAATVLQ